MFLCAYAFRAAELNYVLNWKRSCLLSCIANVS